MNRMIADYLHGTFDAHSRNHILVFAICLGLLLLKSPDAVLHAQLWAEDGAIFYAQQFGSHEPQFFVPYAGYLNLIPRLIAWLGSGVSPANIPLFYNVSALICSAFLITYALIRMSPLFGFAVALSAFFLTPTIGDIFGCITNIQWIAQFALIFGIIGSASPGRNYRFQDLMSSALVLLVSLSGPFSVVDAVAILLLWSIVALGRKLFLPSPFVGAARGIVSNIDPMRVVAMFLGASIQLMTMMRSGVHTPEAANTLTIQDREAFGLGLSYGDYVKEINSPFNHSQLVLLILYIIVFLSFIALMLRSYSSRNLLIVLLLSIGAIQPFLALIKQQEWHTLSSVSHYFYFFGVVALCSTASTIIASHHSHRVAIVASGGACLLLFLIARPEFLIRPRLMDMNWPKFAARISAGDHNVVAPLNPDWRAVINRDR